MRNTLLQMVQSILSDMDSEAVNSISDTVEAEQVASVIQETFFNIVAARYIPEHRPLIKLTSGTGNGTRATMDDFDFQVAPAQEPVAQPAQATTAPQGNLSDIG